MRTLGLLGGMSWESTAVYYRLINQQVAAQRGGLHSAPLLLHSVDFATIAALQAQGDWAGAGRVLGQAGAGLRQAGAQALVLATNTMHKVADAIEAAAGLPLLHIADATGAALQAAGVRQAALLGTRFTMEDDTIVRARLQQRFGLTVRVPDEADRALMHRVIFEELCRGRVLDTSRDAIVALIARQRAAGADAVILGCTEIGLLIDAGCSPLPVFDTTELHAAAAVQWMLGAA
jgi:aspartate racemase